MGGSHRGKRHPIQVRTPAIAILDRVAKKMEEERGGVWGRGEAIRYLAEEWAKREERRQSRRG